jgi:poly-gamma-glutamate synthesis protein (capsule biosynthesis protein)
MKLKPYHKTRYEVERWPLWRLDKNLSYILKSFNHISEPKTLQDKEYYNKNFLYLKKWQKNTQALPHQEGQGIRLATVGDLMWIRKGWKDSLSFQTLQLLNQADATFANLETPIFPLKKVPQWVYETLHYNAPLEFLVPWTQLKPDTKRIFSICNNHALDQGVEGLDATRQNILNHANFYCVGGQELSAAHSEFVLKGTRVVCLGLTFGINHSQNFPEMPPGIPQMCFGSYSCEPDWQALKSYATRLRQSPHDLLILMPHWGYEYEYWPDEIMRKHAHKIIELGFDIILGTSPHVLQPMEVVSINGWDREAPVQIHRSGPSRLGLIVYSLGNFTTIMPKIACQLGMILFIHLQPDTSGVLQISSLQIYPTICKRGLAGNWIGARALTLAEYAQKFPEKATPYWQHAKKILGPFITKEA